MSHLCVHCDLLHLAHGWTFNRMQFHVGCHAVLAAVSTHPTDLAPFGHRSDGQNNYFTGLDRRLWCNLTSHWSGCTSFFVQRAHTRSLCSWRTIQTGVASLSRSSPGCCNCTQIRAKDTDEEKTAASPAMLDWRLLFARKRPRCRQFGRESCLGHC